MMAFVTISENDPFIDLATNFNIIYTVVSPSLYRITLEPKGYIFIYNVTFSFITRPFNGTRDQAINLVPFK